ncbi:DNA-binding protein [Neobacillus notoginsengisoli]|uniref:DNA-binding protein n=1 Tax=Neobacillus notoginsengisoli TaxID=1578198 RepID=A0A417YFN1_9BACI|nr:DNA-binding protein [Neobacillus notoginsengisoli]RHW31507.1 DNA-binding protein [Neobacillus notoginsengisoli]
MFELKLDENELRAMFQMEVQKRLDRMELDSMLLDSKKLCQMLSLSWPTIEKTFLSDPNFPKMRVGTKWMFNRNEVQAYIDRWSADKRKRA